MEIIKESDFRKEIKSPRTGYLFFGEEDYLKTFAVKSLREEISPDETYAFFNEMRLDAVDFTPQKLLDALAPLPMMSEKKLVLLSGLDFGVMKPSELDELCEVLAVLPEYDYNVLVVITSADALDPGYLPKRPSTVLSKLAEYLTPVQFDRSSPAKLSAWIAKHFSHNGVEISAEIASFLMEYCGKSMCRLANEIDKLSFYELSHGRTSVSVEDVKNVCTPVTEYDAFAFANAIMDGQKEKALAILADYRFRRVDPLLILGDVIRIFCDMVSVRAMTMDGASADRISAVLKLHEYKVGLYQKTVRNDTTGRISRALDACREADRSLKLSPQGYSALERLICSL